MKNSKDTSLIRTIILVPMVSVLERFYCIHDQRFHLIFCCTRSYKLKNVHCVWTLLAESDSIHM